MNRITIVPGLLLVLLGACSEYATDGGLKATLVVRAHDDADGSFRLDQELILADGDRVALEHLADGETPRLMTPNGDQVPLEVGTYKVTAYGERVGDTLIATRLETRADDPPRLVLPLLDVYGERKMLMILIGFPGQPNTYDPAAMHAGLYTAAKSTDALYREASRDQMWLGGIDDPEGDVWGPVEVPTDGCSVLSYGEVSELALDAARDAGIDVDAYHHRVYSFPPVNSCPGGGVGGGNQVWIFGITPQYVWDWVGHEAAHGFGFGHASSYDDCTISGDPVTMGGACTHNEYGDPTDIMGGRNFQFSTWYMERAGWLEPENVAVVEASQRVAIAPLETASDRIQSVRVPRGNGEFFHFEYRQPVGFDTGLEPELTNGVLVRVVLDPNERGNPHLLDMTPETPSNRDAALAVGRSFEDGNMLVTVIEANAGQAIIDITLDGVPPDPGSAGSSGSSGTGGSSGGTGGASGAGGAIAGTGGASGAGGAVDTGGTTAGGTGGTATGTAGMAGSAGGSPAVGGMPETGSTGAIAGAGGWAGTPVAGGTPPGTGGYGAAGAVPGQGAGYQATIPFSDGQPSDTGGCGCRTAPRPGRVPGVALLLVLLTLLRRKRATRR